MKCNQCGIEVAANSVFCPQCGERLEETAPPPAPPEDTGAEKFRAAAAATQGTNQVGEVSEQPLWSGSYSGKAMMTNWIGAGLITLAAAFGLFFLTRWEYLNWGQMLLALLGVIVVVWGATALLLVYRRLAIQYTLSSQRFVHEKGVLRRTTDRIEVIDMDDVTCTQNLIERMLGVGTIKISSSDRTHPELVMPGIDDVKRVASLIDDTRRTERRRRGLFVESV